MLNVLLCADTAMRAGLRMAAISAAVAARESAITFHIAGEMSPDDCASLARTIEMYCSKSVTAIPLSLETLDIPASLRRFRGSTLCYARLFAADVIDVDRLLYLDSDVLVDVDIAPLFQMNLDGHVTGMVAHGLLSDATEWHYYKSLGLAHDRPYWNSGVMLFDVQQWRNQAVSQRIRQIVERDAKSFTMADQMILNACMNEQVCSIPGDFNCAVWPDHPRQPNRDQRNIWHYIGFPKPWFPLAANLCRSFSHYWGTAHAPSAAEFGPSLIEQFQSLRQYKRLYAGAAAKALARTMKRTTRTRHAASHDIKRDEPNPASQLPWA